MDTHKHKKNTHLKNCTPIKEIKNKLQLEILFTFLLTIKLKIKLFLCYTKVVALNI